MIVCAIVIKIPSTPKKVKHVKVYRQNKEQTDGRTDKLRPVSYEKT